MSVQWPSAVKVAHPGPIHTNGIFAVDNTVSVPAPAGRDLTVEVRATSVNPIDTKVRSGKVPGPESGILGFDAAGVVTAVGPSTRFFEVGDEVFYAGQLDRCGANATHQVVDERIVGHKPRNTTFAEAASLPLTGLTAWEGLFDKLQLRSDSVGNLLVLGGAGGVGSMVIQLAHALTDVRIIATASRPGSRRWAQTLGAHVVVNHAGEDFEEQIRRAAPSGIDYVFSTHSAGILPMLARVMNPFGQIVAIDSAPEDDFQLLKPKALSWHWEYMFARPIHGALDISNQHRALDAISDLVEARKIRPTMKELLLGVTPENLREAHRRVELGHMVGKIVLARDDVPTGNLTPKNFPVG